jgi:lysophospholipase L1-like esterase
VEHVTKRNHTEANPRNTVVVLGASYAAGWPLQSIGDTRVINKGVSGQQSWELLERFDQDVVSLSPRAVIIWGFINDVYRADRSALGDALTRAQQSILAMIDRARASGIEPIVATEVTIRGRLTLSEDVASLVGRILGKQSYQSYVNRHVLDLNAWLREVAQQHGLLLLDLQPVITGPDGFRRRAHAAPDGSHISTAGYDALTRFAVPILRDHLAPTRK